MAYVALSRVKSLAGLHLICFDSNSIKVNLGCIKEINRLRKLHRSDLPLIDVPVACKRAKCTVTATCNLDGPPAKKQCTSAVKRCARAKRKDTDTCEFDGPPAKKRCTSAVEQPQTSTPQSAVVTKHMVWPFKYHSVDEEWQRTTCKTLGLDSNPFTGELF